jgi:hypothetical protein
MILNDLCVGFWLAGMYCQGQKELFHALHYALAHTTPDDYDLKTKLFHCEPAKKLPLGWSTPILPLCIRVYRSKNLTELGLQLKEQERDATKPKEASLASFLLMMADPGSLKHR